MFYVYTLTDPRDGEVFYIGKGKGRRAWVHETAERGGYEKNGLKAERLAHIRRAGLKPTVTLVHEGLSEREAYRLERGMIFAQRDRLTNISMGSRTALECVQADVRESLRKIKPLCVLLRERPSADRLRVWAAVVSGLARIHTKAA